VQNIESSPLFKRFLHLTYLIYHIICMQSADDSIFATGIVSLATDLISPNVDVLLVGLTLSTLAQL